MLFRQVRVHLLIPLYYNPDKQGYRVPIEPERIHATKEEVTRRFGGFTSTTLYNEGKWISKKTGKEQEDITKTFYIDLEPSPENIKWLLEYKEKLKERFKQEEVYMTISPVFVL